MMWPAGRACQWPSEAPLACYVRDMFGLVKRYKIPQQTFRFPEPVPKATEDAQVIVQCLFQSFHCAPFIGQH